MDKNKKPEDLPEDETKMDYECISMDGFQTDAGEHGLAIVDRHTGYIWCDRETGKLGRQTKYMQFYSDTLIQQSFM